MDLNAMYDKAYQIASCAHAGQVDKAGQCYFLHPLRVADRCQTAQAKIVALLHDTIEDTDVTAEYLRQEGFPDEIVAAVLSVTKERGETYEDFIARVARNPIGREVKLADLEDNMNVGRLSKLTAADIARTHKYRIAWDYLHLQ